MQAADIIPSPSALKESTAMGACMSWQSAASPSASSNSSSSSPSEGLALSSPGAALGMGRSAQVRPCSPSTPAKAEDAPPCKARRRDGPDATPSVRSAGTAHEKRESLLLLGPGPLSAPLLPSKSAPATTTSAASGAAKQLALLFPLAAQHAGAAQPAASLARDRPVLVLGAPPMAVANDGDFPLSSNPGILLRILAECNVDPADLARLEATCKFFRAPAGFPPDVSLGLTEMAALDACMQRPTFRAMPPALQARVRAACGGTWKLLLRFLLARERCTRVGQPQVAAGCAHSVVVGRTGSAWAFGVGAVGQLGLGVTCDAECRPRKIPDLRGVRLVQVAAGRSRTMLVTECGRVMHCGRDSFGDQEYSLASPKTIHTPRPVQALEAQGIHVVQVAMGSFFTAVLSAEGRVYTFAWGETERLGHATDVSDAEPRLLAGGGLEKVPVVQIAGGHCYLLALTLDKEQGRSVWSVGCGLGGKLGHGTRSDERIPKEIAHFRSVNFKPVAVAAGAWHAAALSSDGRVATWGWGRHGCLGHGGDQCETVPRVIECLQGQVAYHVAAGDYTTFVVGAQGQVWSFGSSESSCLGHGAPPEGPPVEEGDNDDPADAHYDGPRQRPRDVLLPRRVLALEACVGPRDRIVQISTSNSGHWDAHMLALTEQGMVLACGAGSKGQLGCVLPEGAQERSVPCAIEGLVL